MSMTLAQFQTKLHQLYQADTDTPSLGDEDYTLRTTYLEIAIEEWETEMGMIWNELWTTLEDAADGDKTVVADTLQYDPPTDFKGELGAWVKTEDADGNITKYKVVKPQKNEVTVETPGSTVYVTGNESDGFKINFSKQPTAGETIDYPYYKKATIPSAVGDIIEMSDPRFAIHHALAVLRENDGEGDRSILELTKAQARMDGMITKNSMTPYYQGDEIEDIDYVNGISGFGR